MWLIWGEQELTRSNLIFRQSACSSSIILIPIIIIDFFELVLKIIDMDKVGPVGTFGLIWVTPAALPGSLQPAIGPSMHNIYCYVSALR